MRESHGAALRGQTEISWLQKELRAELGPWRMRKRLDADLRLAALLRNYESLELRRKEGNELMKVLKQMRKTKLHGFSQFDKEIIVQRNRKAYSTVSVTSKY